MNNNEICPHYTADKIWFRGKHRKICAYWNLDEHGLCKHEEHNTCLVYLNNNGITDPWLIKFMDDLGCVLI